MTKEKPLLISSLPLCIVPKDNIKLTAVAFCTIHGLWQSDEVKVEVK